MLLGEGGCVVCLGGCVICLGGVLYVGWVCCYVCVESVVDMIIRVCSRGGCG